MQQLAVARWHTPNRYVLAIHSPVMDLGRSTDVNTSTAVPKDIHCAGILPEPAQSRDHTADVAKRNTEEL
jgi:hypothetical protein